MLRKLLIIAVAALVVVPAAGAATARTLLMPGVTHERDVQFTSHGPVVVHVLRAPRPGGLYALKPVLSNDVILGRERVTQMQRRLGGIATVAGINGDMFHRDGRPSGMLMLSGVLASASGSDRSNTGIAADGTLRVDRVRFAGTWRGSGQRRPLGLNREPGAAGAALYTPLWGGATPARNDTVEAVISPFPAAEPGRDLVGQVVQLKQGGSTPIPPGGAVISARGVSAARLPEEAPVGSSVTVRLVLTPDWSSMVDAIGGGPVLVRDRRPIFRANEIFTPDQLVPRHPRSAVGQLADGRVVLVAVDGRQPGYSVGMTNFELALTMARLGAVTACALDIGGSVTMAFEGRLLNRPSEPGGERAVSESLNVFYYGVHAPQASEEVLSPDGDGVGERQTLAYKLVRPSTVAARLVAPDGSERPLDVGPRGPGVYRFAWSGRTSGDAVEPEGAWRFVVDAIDAGGQRSTVTRAFSLNRTLGFLRAPRSASVGRRGRGVRATFTLTRTAAVGASVYTASGAFVRTLAERSLTAGTHSVVWNGRDARGSLVHRGRYELRVSARNEIGTAVLTAEFTVRRR